MGGSGCAGCGNCGRSSLGGGPAVRNLVEVTVSAEKCGPAAQSEAAVRLLRLEARSLKCFFRKRLTFPSFSSLC